MSDVSLSLDKSIRAKTKEELIALFQHHSLRYRWLIAYVLAYALTVSITLIIYDRSFWLLNWKYFLSAAIPPALALTCYLIGAAIEYVVENKSFSFRRIDEKIHHDQLLTWERAAYVTVPFLLVPFFASFFTALKTAIPTIHPFAYDELFMEMDVWLHFGTAPWEWLQPLLGHPLITSIISFFYNLWLPLMYLFLWWHVLSAKSPKLRMQYLYSFIFAWSLLGGLAAVLLSSAGPVYYEHFVDGVNPYAALLSYHQVAAEVFPNWALTAQAYLWENFTSNTDGIGAGISAMPSLHVSVAFLMALTAWRTSRIFGAVMYAYLGMILIGSVHLAWHYAVDGYLSLILTYGIWCLSGWIVKRSRHIPQMMR